MIVLKRNGNKEKFSSSKLLKTIIRLFGYVDDKVTPDDELIAGTISGKLEYLNKKDNIELISSDEIRSFAVKELNNYGRNDVAEIFNIKKNTFKDKAEG